MRQFLFAIAASVAGLFGHSAFAESSLTGSWNTSFGKIEIFEEYAGSGKANRFYGTYANNGFVYGHNNGTTARGIFVYADQTTGQRTDAAKFGTFYWNQNQPGDKFTGQWSWGKNAPTGGTWQGTRTSSDTPSFDKSKLRRWSANYVIEAGAQLNNWMQSVQNLPNAGFAKPTINTAPDSMQTRQTGLRQSAPPADRAPREPSPEEVELAQIMKDFDLRPFEHCLVPPGMSGWLTCGSRQSSGRWLMPISLCNAGTLTPYGAQANCLAKVEGSYSRSCTDMTLQSAHTDYSTNIARVPPRLTAFCSGPKTGVFSNGDVLSRTNSTRVSIANGYYKNEVNHDWCPSMRFWNEGGYLRCSR